MTCLSDTVSCFLAADDTGMTNVDRPTGGTQQNTVYLHTLTRTQTCLTTNCLSSTEAEQFQRHADMKTLSC